MPYDYPKPLTYNAREDIDRLWEDLWRIVEQLRLAEEEMARREKAAEAAGSKAGAGSTASAKPKHLLPFGKVTGNTSSSAKTATVPGVTELKDGVACYIINDATSTASGWTINVNGLGAKHVYNSQGGGAITTTYAANYCMLFIYNEARDSGNGGWDMYYGYDSNTNTLASTVRTQTTDRTVADRLARYQICFTIGTSLCSEIFPAALIPSGSSYNTGTNKTMNTTRAFDPRRPILYYGGTTNTPANTQAAGNALWRQYSSIDLRYAFNVTTALIACVPVYIRCSPTTDGFLKLDGNDCLTQTLPSTADGKVYMYLGMAHGSNGRDMELDPEHPCYEFKDGAVKPWNG